MLDKDIRNHLGRQLRAMYAGVKPEGSNRLGQLGNRLGQLGTPPAAATDARLKAASPERP